MIILFQMLMCTYYLNIEYVKPNKQFKHFILHRHRVRGLVDTKEDKSKLFQGKTVPKKWTPLTNRVFGTVTVSSKKRETEKTMKKQCMTCNINCIYTGHFLACRAMRTTTFCVSCC